MNLDIFILYQSQSILKILVTADGFLLCLQPTTEFKITTDLYNKDTFLCNMFWKSQPEYRFYCKCHDEQIQFNPQDDRIRLSKLLLIEEFEWYTGEILGKTTSKLAFVL